ncbi:MAG: sodium ion-translocating decarboxylase subunit beta, partial [Clostridia bacterium]|nr:sodium ion-translocating decarboxylase subunit beta [Clostridia bacterium]
MDIGAVLLNLWKTSGLYGLFAGFNWQSAVMIVIACVLLYLGIVKQFEPLLLIGIAFGMLLTNLPFSGVYNPELWLLTEEVTHIDYGRVLHEGGLIDML